MGWGHVSISNSVLSGSPATGNLVQLEAENVAQLPVTEGLQFFVVFLYCMIASLSDCDFVSVVIHGLGSCIFVKDSF